MADTSADAPQATFSDLRAPSGAFHGLHGQRRAARTGGVIPAPGVRKCKRCGALMHPDATHCPKGHSRVAEAALERRVEEAIRLHRRGGGRYDPHLHPRDREGKFRDTPGAPARTMTPGAPRGSGAVVGGKVGRWVPIRGTKVHVPLEHEWERRFVDGVRFYSPAGSTEVHRVASGRDEVVSVPGAKITHPELQRTAPEGMSTTVVRGSAPAPAPAPAPATALKLLKVSPGRYVSEDGRYGVMQDGWERRLHPEATGDDSRRVGGEGGVPGGEWAAMYDAGGRLNEDSSAGENIDWYPTKREAVASVQRHALEKKRAADRAAAPVPSAAEPPTARERARSDAAARDAIERANPNAIPEPTGPTLPGSLAGKDLSRVHPIEIDRELARLYGESSKYEGYIASIMSTHARDQARDRGYNRTPREMDARTQATLAGYREKLAELTREAQPMNDEFSGRGGWTRYFKVTNGNGHVHKSMHCRTTYPTTEYAWLVDLAGKNEHEMVKAHGESACSVCFPSAPSEYEAMKAAGHVSHSQRATNEQRAARDAERARRAADKATKAITNPDGSPLKLGGRFGDTIRTLVTARKELVDAINDVKHARRLQGNGSITGSPEHLAQKQGDVDLLVAAIAHKLNVEREKVMAEAQAKADAKWRKETWRHG